jgi:hypothetical protein
MSTASTNGRASKAKPPAKTAAQLLQAAAQPSSRLHRLSPFDYDGDLQALAGQIIELTRHKAELERTLGLAHDDIRRTLDPWYRDRLGRHGYEASVRVPAGPHGFLRVSYQHRYLKLPQAKADLLQELLGARFEQFFHVAVALKVRKEVAEDPPRLAQVVVQLGALLGDDFARIFEAEQTLLPTRAFTEQRYRQWDAALNERLEAAGVHQVVAMGEAR